MFTNLCQSGGLRPGYGAPRLGPLWLVIQTLMKLSAGESLGSVNPYSDATNVYWSLGSSSAMT